MNRQTDNETRLRRMIIKIQRTAMVFNETSGRAGISPV